MSPRSFLPAPRVYAEHKAEFRSIEATLFEARLRADAIDEPVLTYFIDMAIAQVRGMTQVDQETPGPRIM